MKILLLLWAMGASLVFAANTFPSDQAAVFKAARKENKPILIDFYGIWCPPCNQLNETVFETTQFVDKSKSFKLLKVDADAVESWKIKDRYKVGGYPTIVFTNPKGDEIYRIVGYRNLKEFLRVMDLVLAANGEDLKQACRKKDDVSLWRCAVVCMERKDDKCAAKAFKGLETKLAPGTAKYDLARTYAADKAGTPELVRDQIERLLKDSPDSPQALYWSLQYLDADIKPEPKKEIVAAVLTNYSKLTADSRAEELGISRTDMAQIRADLLEKIGKVEEAKLAWQEAAELLSLEIKKLPQGSEARGYSIEQVFCLEAAGNLDAALKLANEFRIRFPEEFTFHFMAASMLERQKKYPDAIAVARRAYDVSYGDNRIRAATLLLKLYGTVPDRASAKSVYESVKAQFKPQPGLEVRTHRYLKKLNDAAGWINS